MRSLKLQLLKVCRIHEAIKDEDMTGARVLLPLTMGGGLAFIVMLGYGLRVSTAAMRPNWALKIDS